MPAHRKGARVLKRWIDERRAWRVIAILADGRRSAREFGVEADADGYRKEWEAHLARLSEVTVERAIVIYKGHLLKEGNRSSSVEDTEYRLRSFFAPALKARVTSITAERAKFLYLGRYDGERLVEHGLVTRPTYKQRDEKGNPVGPPLAADSHRNMLMEAKTFGRWWVSKGWVAASPLEGLQGVGRRNKGGLGKSTLRKTELRALDAAMVAKAKAGDERAVGAMMALYMGMRAQEIVTRQVRDLDVVDWTIGVDLAHAKTAASEREMGVPRIMRPMLARLIKGKAPEQFIFGGDRPHWRDWVRESIQRICASEGIPLETAHGLRGAHSDLAREAGATGELVARQLGHEKVSTGEQSYTRRRTVEAARQQRTLRVLRGGRR